LRSGKLLAINNSPAMTRKPLAAHHAPASNTPMAKVRKIGRVTFRTLTNEEALQEYGSSFVFVGTPPAPPPREAVTKLKTNAKKSNRSPK
jgi:hypothetical protein